MRLSQWQEMPLMLANTAVWRFIAAIALEGSHREQDAVEQAFEEDPCHQVEAMHTFLWVGIAW